MQRCNLQLRFCQVVRPRRTFAKHCKDLQAYICAHDMICMHSVDIMIGIILRNFNYGANQYQQ